MMAGERAERWTLVDRLELRRSVALPDVDDDPVRAEALLKERAAHLARSHVQRAPRAAFLTLRIGSERSALELERISGIERCAALTPVPGGPPELAGLVCRRGEILTVVDLGCLLGVERGRRSGGAVLVLRACRQAVGLLVDAAERVTHLDAEVVETVQPPGHPLIRCMADSGTLAVLDATALAAALNERSF